MIYSFKGLELFCHITRQWGKDESNSVKICIFLTQVFLDFSKAFDTVIHETLLEKLENYGFRGIAYLWFKSYLHKRMQIINITGTDSNELNITCVSHKAVCLDAYFS